MIIGDTGCGKSTLLNILNGVIPHILESDLEGEVFVEDKSTKELNVSEIAKYIGTVFQNPENQIFMLTVEDDVAFSCENQFFPKEEIIRRREIAIKNMRLGMIRNKNTSTLSAGEIQRTAIAGIYALSPNILLFDEPTANLDFKARLEFVKLLKKLKSDGHTIIIAEHQYDDFVPIADRVLVMKDGNLTEWELEWESQKTSLSNKPYLPNTTDKIIIETQDLTFSYNSNNKILENVNLKIKKGDIVGLVGDNGSGKTTLFKLLSGILKTTSGDITIDGIKNPSLSELVGKVSFVFQNPDEQLFTNTVFDEINFGLRNLKLSYEPDRILEIFNLDRYKERHPHTLSRGERKSLAIASAFSIKPKILFLDELTTGLNKERWNFIFASI